MQPVPGLVGAGQAVQCGALLRSKDAATCSWGGGGLGGNMRQLLPTRVPCETAGLPGENTVPRSQASTVMRCVPEWLQGTVSPAQGAAQMYREPTFTCARAGCMHTGRTGLRVGHLLSAWLPRPPKAVLPRVPRPPKVLDLLKGSVGAAGSQVPVWLQNPAGANYIISGVPWFLWSPPHPWHPSPEVCRDPDYMDLRGHLPVR